MKRGAYDMSDRVEIMAKCHHFKYVKGNTLYCAKLEKPIAFSCRAKLNKFMHNRCNGIDGKCSFNTDRTMCSMETILIEGRHACRAYAIECDRANCKYYKSKHDAKVAEIKTEQRLLTLPDEEREYINKKYGRSNKF